MGTTLFKEGLERDLGALAEEYVTLEELDDAIAWYNRDRFAASTVEQRADARLTLSSLRRIRQHHDRRVLGPALQGSGSPGVAG